MNLFGGAIGNGLHRLGNDITHPFGMGNPAPPPPQPIRTPAPMPQPQAPRPIIRTPAPISQAPQHNIFSSIGNAISHIGQAPHPIQTQPLPSVMPYSPKAQQVIQARNPNVTAQRLAQGHQMPAPFQAPKPSIANGLSTAGDALDQATMKTIVQPFITRPAMEVAQTVRQKVTNKPSTYTPGSPEAQALFGNSPIASIQKKVTDQYKRQSTSTNPVLRLASKPLAAGEVALSVANDIPVVGGVAKAGVKGLEKVAPKAIPAAKVIAKDVNVGVKAAQDRAGTQQAITAQQNQLKREISQHQDRINQLPLNDHNAQLQAEGLQKKINTKQGQIQQLEANRPQQNVVQKVSDRILAAQPGMSMKAFKATKTYQTIHAGGEIKPVQGEPVQLVKGVDTFIHQGTGGHVVSEASTGRHIGTGTTKEQAIAAAKANIQSVGEPKFKQMLAENQLPKPTAPVKSTMPVPEQPQSAAEPQLPASTETGAVSLPNNTKVRGLTKSIQGSPEFSPELQKAVKSEYTPFTNKAATQSTDQFMKQKLDKAKSQVMQTLADTTTKKQAVTGEFGKQEVSNAGAVIKALDAKGDVAGAQAVHDLLAAKLTNAGQTGQAAQLIYNRTPEGLKYMAQRDLTKSKVPITPELKAKMDAGIKAIKATKDGTRANDLARAKFQQLVGKQIPTSATDKGLGLWRTGILSAPETAVKVAVANPINTVLENLADTAAAPIDKAVSLFTGKRSMVAPNARNIKAGATAAVKRGIPDAITRLKDDIALPGTTGMGQAEIAGKGARAEGLNFGVGKNGQRTKLDKATGGVSSKILNGYTSSIGRVHGGLQVPNYVGRTAQALNQAAEAEALNRGLKGAEKTAFINDFVAHPTAEAKAAADSAAQYATSQQHTLIGQAASGLQHNLGPLGKIIAPITRVPGAVATQMINYSPAGFVKTAGTAALDAKRGGGFDQQAFSRGMGRAIVGTGLGAGGVALAAQGRTSGEYPKDKATQQLWQSANIPANSVYVGGHAVPGQPWKNSGGTWQQISSPGGAAAQSALAGSAAYDGYKNGGLSGAALQGAQGGAQIATNQPYLTGISGAMGAINTPSQAKSFLDQTAGSVVPNFLRTAASATDPLQRQTSVQSVGQSIKNSVTNGVPGLREKNQPQVDVMGNVLPRNNSPVGAYLNPFKPQQSTPSQLTNAMGDIHNNTDVNGKPLSIPTQINKKYPIKDATGKTTPLTDAQRTQFIQSTGQAAQAAMNQKIQSAEYKNATPEQQSKMLADIMSGQRNQLTNQISDGAVKLTAAGKAARSGNLPTIGTNGKVTDSGANNLNPKIDKQSATTLNKYANMSATDRKKAQYSDPKFDYNYAQAKYNNDTLNNSLSTADKIKAQDSLAKEKVGANYDKNVRDLYGLSKAQLANYLTTQENGVDKQKLGDQLKQYDQALYDAGLTSSLKYKDGVITNKDGSLASVRKAGSGSSGGQSTASKLAAVSKANVSYSGVGTGMKSASSKFRVPSLKTKLGSGKATIKGYTVPKAAKLASVKRPSSRVNLNAKLPKRSALI